MTAFFHFFADLAQLIFFFFVYDSIQFVDIVGDGARNGGPAWNFLVLRIGLVLGRQIDGLNEERVQLFVLRDIMR